MIIQISKPILASCVPSALVLLPVHLLSGWFQIIYALSEKSILGCFNGLYVVIQK